MMFGYKSPSPIIISLDWQATEHLRVTITTSHGPVIDKLHLSLRSDIIVFWECCLTVLTSSWLSCRFKLVLASSSQLLRLCRFCRCFLILDALSASWAALAL